MKRLSALCGLLLLFVIPAAAQTPSTEAPQGESGSQTTPQETTPPAPAPPAPVIVYPYEISAGYSLRVFTEPTDKRVGLNGGYGSFEYKILSRLSAEGELTAGFRDSGNNGDLSIYSVLVGAQGYPFKHRRKLTPFVHILFGEGYYRDSFPAYAGFPHDVFSTWDFTWEGGGGVDLTHNTHWSFRAEVDYAPTKFFSSQSQTNYRGAIGIVYRFGEK